MIEQAAAAGARGAFFIPVRLPHEVAPLFRAWLDAQPPQDKTAWVKLFKKTFTFTGGEITGEFLMSSGYLPGAHQPDCPVYPRILAARPRWAAQEDGNAP